MWRGTGLVFESRPWNTTVVDVSAVLNMLNPEHIELMRLMTAGASEPGLFGSLLSRSPLWAGQQKWMESWMSSKDKCDGDSCPIGTIGHTWLEFEARLQQEFPQV